MNKETLEDAAELFADDEPNCDYEAGIKTGKYQGFIAGAKWQQERMYSEVIEFAEWIRNNPCVWNYPDKLNDTRTTEELFEQYKKK